MNDIIEKAVLPLKQDAIERAEKEALKLIEKVKAELEAAGNDLRICAPYPESFGVGRVEFQIKLQKYKLFNSLIKWREGTQRPGTPIIADINQLKVSEFIKNSKEDAAAQYDAFVKKLKEKIGECNKATLLGNHVWGYSFLNIDKEDGVRETWKTQQIVNISKLGKLFNQWPSRKVKQ